MRHPSCMSSIDTLPVTSRQVHLLHSSPQDLLTSPQYVRSILKTCTVMVCIASSYTFVFICLHTCFILHIIFLPHISTFILYACIIVHARLQHSYSKYIFHPPTPANSHKTIFSPASPLSTPSHYPLHISCQYILFIFQPVSCTVDEDSLLQGISSTLSHHLLL